MATEPATETTLQGPAAWEDQAEKERVHGLGPWRLGLRRLKRNKVALFFGALFIVLVLSCLAAPIWADKVAKTGVDTNHLSDTITVDGKPKNVVGLDGVPIGPQYWKADHVLRLAVDRDRVRQVVRVHARLRDLVGPDRGGEACEHEQDEEGAEEERDLVSLQPA